MAIKMDVVVPSPAVFFPDQYFNGGGVVFRRKKNLQMGWHTPYMYKFSYFGAV